MESIFLGFVEMGTETNAVPRRKGSTGQPRSMRDHIRSPEEEGGVPSWLGLQVPGMGLQLGTGAQPRCFRKVLGGWTEG
jgi:hypothetical protein